MKRGRLRPLLVRLWGSRDGAAAVETAFLLPTVLFLLLAVIECGRIAWTQTALNFAVQEAARCAAVRPGVCGTAAQTAGYAAGKVTALGIPASAFEVAARPCGTEVRAEVRHRFAAVAVFPTEPVLTARVCRA